MFENKKIHMIGIGGISMSGIAKILLSFNASVTGYDMKESDITKSLIESGIDVNYSANLDNVKNADIIIYTAAIKDDNEELKYAKLLNKQVYERGTFFGLLMKEYKNVLCISGTHGKSTTTGMVSTIFVKAGKNPTIQIGAMLPLINGNFKVGSKEFFIAEACEYHDSFLEFFPTHEVILNIDNDHLDYFKNIDNIIASFKKYTALLPQNGNVIVNMDDINAMKACENANIITYGINNNAKYMAKNITLNNGLPEYDLYINNEYKEHISLSVRGNHNVYNSLAAIALANLYIEDLSIIKDALKEYTGVGRRFEYLGKYNGVLVYDDYAHHPSEIKTTLDSVKNVNHNQNFAIFMPHTFSRTKDHLNEFAEVLSKFDNIIIAPIYAARETNIYNVCEEDLVNLIKKENPNVIFLDNKEKIISYIKSHAKDGDLIISIGAGNIDEVTKSLVNKNE